MRLSSRRGFTLVEVLIATALLAFSLAVMFGLHTQSVRSNLAARKVTDCSYLAQSQLEELHSLEWTSSGGRAGTDIGDGTITSTADWDPLYQPNGGALPTAVNAIGELDGAETDGQPAATYYVTWQVQDNSSDGTWVQMWVRCAWEDRTFGTWSGTTVSSYKFRDN